MIDAANIGREYYYDAFISYRHTEPDMEAALRLHRALEGFRVPRSIAKQTGIKKIKRLFRDLEELPTSNNLSEDIKKALEQSRYLIVVCSPRTPKSNWCCQEIEDFRKLHGDNRILSILIEGEPEESFPEALCSVDERVENPDGTVSIVKHEVEPLAADIRGKDAHAMWKKLKVEKLRLLAPMIGVKFDDLKQRHRERLIKRAAALASAVSVIFAAFGIVASIQSNIIRSQSQELIQKNSELEIQIAQKEEQRTLAEKNGLEAVKQADIALNNQKKAEENALTAQKNEQEAQRQKGIAEENATEAQMQKTLAEENALEAQRQESIALKKAKEAKTERDIALYNESKALAEMSRRETDDGNRLTGVKLALNALPGNIESSDRPFSAEAISSLYNALYNKPYQGRLLINDHSGLINDAVYIAGGRYLATASNDCTIKIRDLADGSIKTSISGLDYSVVSIDASPDGKFLATLGMGEIRARIWDVGTGKLVTSLNPFDREFFPGYCEFSSDGRYIILTNSTFGAAIYETGSWKLVSILEGDIYFYNQYKTALDGRLGRVLMYSLTKSDFMVYDLIDGKACGSGSIEGKITNADFSPDGRRIAVCSDNGSVYIFDSSNLKEVNILEHSGSVANGVVFDKKNGFMLSYYDDGTACLWDDMKGELLHTFSEEYGAVLSACFSPDGNTIVTAHEKNMAVVWNCATGERIALLDKHRNAVFRVMFSPDGRTISTISNDNTIRVWDVNPGKEYRVLAGHTDVVNSVDYSPDGSKLVTASSDNTLRVWDPTSGKQIFKYKVPDAWFINARFSRDGKKIMTDELDKKEGVVKVLNVSDGSVDSTFGMAYAKLASNDFENMNISKRLYNFFDLDSALWDMPAKPDFDKISYNFFEYDINRIYDCFLEYGSFSPDGKRFVSVGRSLIKGFSIGIWNLEKSELVANLKINFRTGYSAQYAFFSPDSKRVLTVSFGLGINIWDAITGEKIYKLPDQTSLYTYAAYSPDGRLLATSCVDGTVCLWNASDGSLITKLTGHRGMATWLDFSPDGKSLATVSSEGEVIIWRIFPGTQELIDYSGSLLETY